ncbi:MAG: hypothetical protein IJP09_01920 [Clostridia bacterium]|nr:hypothetical protein [Clostridia bacterium]
MVKMEKFQLDAFTLEDLAEYEFYTKKGVLGVFIYNKNIYYKGERIQIDSENYKVRTELRSGVTVSPISVFRVLEGCEYGEDFITVNEKTLKFKVGESSYYVNGVEGEFQTKPFEFLSHIYIPIAEFAQVLGFSVYFCYKNRLILIGKEDVISQLKSAVIKNSALEIAAAREAVGYYDAYRFTHKDYVMAKDNWRKFLLGTPELIDMNDADIMRKVHSRATSALSLMSTMNRDKNAVILWGENPPSVTDDIMEQYAKIRDMALAWGTYGSELYHNDELENAIIFGLKWMNEHMYGDAEIEGRGWRDIKDFNWWHWYVGGPEALTDILLIMENQLSKEDIFKYIKPFKWFLDNWRLLYTQDQCSGRMSVGTKCALILEDPERLTISYNGYHVMLDIVLTGPGTHTDYCNYQHNLPYNMVYGLSNLDRVLKVGSILANTPLEFISPRCYNQYMLFKYMYEAAMYRGRGFTCFMGRAGNGTEIRQGIGVLCGILPMIGIYGPEEDAEIKHFIKYSIAEPENTEALKSGCTISHLPIVVDILNDDSISGENDYTCAHAWFTADRATQHKNDYAFTVSMPSYRHISYECINHENYTGWYMNDGGLYLYTNNDKNAFDGINFSMNKRLAHRIPGTTVDIRTRPEVSISEGWIPPSDKVGCMDFEGKYIVAGMDYQCYNMEVGDDAYVDTGYGGGLPKFPNDLVARKSYFMFDDECVCLGAGISSTMNADVNTIVEHRRLVKTEVNENGTDLISVNGKEMPIDIFDYIFDNPSYARVEGFAGFVFIDAPKVSVNKYFYSIKQEETKEQIIVPEYAKKDRPFIEIMINHGENPQNATYAYAVLPYATDEKLAKYSANPDFEIISNTSECQAVREKTLGVTGIIFYEAGECSGIKVDRACLVTFSEKGREFKIKICEPTNKTERVNVEISKNLSLVSAHDRYAVDCADVTKLTLDVSSSEGEGYEATFKCN